MAFCFYLIQGLFVVTVYALSRVEVRRLLTVGCVGYLLIQLLFSDFVITNHFVSNTLDEVYANMMYQEVLKYEEETGNEVTKIAVYKECNLSRGQLQERIKSHEYNRLSSETKIKLIESKELKVNDLIPNPIIIKSDSLKEEISEYALKQLILNNLDDFLTFIELVLNFYQVATEKIFK